MKIALVQFKTKIRQSFLAISRHVINFIEKAKKQNSQIICFPEDFWFGPLDYYSDNEIKEITTSLFCTLLTGFVFKQKNTQLISFLVVLLLKKKINILINFFYQ